MQKLKRRSTHKFCQHNTISYHPPIIHRLFNKVVLLMRNEQAGRFSSRQILLGASELTHTNSWTVNRVAIFFTSNIHYLWTRLRQPKKSGHLEYSNRHPVQTHQSLKNYNASCFVIHKRAFSSRMPVKFWVKQGCLLLPFFSIWSLIALWRTQLQNAV